MKLLLKLPHFKPGLRRFVFWTALAVMSVAAPVGLIWRLVTWDWGAGPVAALTLGIGALLVAIVFALLEFTNPTFHPESELFSWDDVDTLRNVARAADDSETRDWARSLADRIAVVLPGRPSGERRAHQRIRNSKRVDQRDR